MNQNMRGEVRMLRLENEVDPKIVQPKHLKGKKIIFRRGDEVLISEVIVIAEQCFVRYFGITMDITQMDGWTKIPVVSYL
jgi:hypothetical protein